MNDFESGKRWFKEGAFAESVEKYYSEWLGIICAFLKENPDTLVALIHENSNPQGQILEIVTDLTEYMDKKLNLKVDSVRNRLSILYSFLRANGIPISRDDIRIINEELGGKWRLRKGPG